MNDLDVLTRYWLEHYATNLPTDACVAIVGGQADAVATRAMPDETEFQSAGFLTGLIGYPCDMIHVVVVVPVLAEINDEPDRPALVCFAHTVPTRESQTTMVVRQMRDDGSTYWSPSVISLDESLFAPVEYAAHDFDRFPIAEVEGAARQDARRMLAGANGSGYTVEFLQPGQTLDAARAACEAR